MKRLRGVCCGFAGAMLIGCSTYSPPDLEVTGVDVVERSEHGTVIRIVVRAVNSNSDPLPLREAEYSLSIDGDHLFTGTRSPEATLRGYGTQFISLPAVVPPGTSVDDGTPYSVNGWIIYQIPGAFADILFDAELRRPSAGFSVQGRFGEPITPSTVTMSPISPLGQPEPSEPPESQEPVVHPEESVPEQQAAPPIAPESEIRWSRPKPTNPQPR